MKKQIVSIGGIIAVLLLFSMGTASAQCNAVQSNNCGSRQLCSSTNFFTGAYYCCTAPDGGKWQSVKDATQGFDNTSPATFTCTWTCTAYDDINRPISLGPVLEDINTTVPSGNKCGGG
jgi:hypothetical protein